MTGDADRPINERITPHQFAADVRAERTTFLVLTLAAVSLAVIEYTSTPAGLYLLFPVAVHPLLQFVWWTGGIAVMWILLPLALARLLGFGLRELGLGVRGLSGRLGAFALLYVAVLPLIVWASTTSSFVATYPLVRVGDGAEWTWRLLIGYWLLYGLQFVGVEFFFRGFLLFTLRPRFGYAAIAVMIVPYCMVHFHKPFPEAMGAIVGGAVLGWLALRTESIWGGVLVHVAVAFSMDTLAMLRGGLGLPGAW